jgi:hypothetical protein
MDTVKIIQIVRSEWKGREGDMMEDFIGLGDDGMLYKWNKGHGKWLLYIITKQ